MNSHYFPLWSFWPEFCFIRHWDLNASCIFVVVVICLIYIYSSFMLAFLNHLVLKAPFLYSISSILLSKSKWTYIPLKRELRFSLFIFTNIRDVFGFSSVILFHFLLIVFSTTGLFLFQNAYWITFLHIKRPMFLSYGYFILLCVTSHV